MSSASVPSMSSPTFALQGAPLKSSSFIRLSPTAFFKSHSKSSVSTLLSSLMNDPAKEVVGTASSLASDLISTPKSHHRRHTRLQGQSAGAARKKLCYPEESSNNRGDGPMQRNVCFIPKSVQNRNGASPTMKKTASQPQCQSAGMYDNKNFSATNVYATPPRHSLRRQQSATATLVPVGNGRYRSNTAFVRFTPPIGEDVSALYAGSKFSDSPSAKSLPLPPAAWLEELAAHTTALNLKAIQTADQMSGDDSVKSLKNVAEEEEDGVISDDTGVVFDLDDGKCSSPSAASDSSMQLATTEEEGSDAGEIHPKLVGCLGHQANQGAFSPGIRLTPLQLIAAVVAS